MTLPEPPLPKDPEKALGRRLANSTRSILAAVGIARPRQADGTLGPRHLERLFGLVGGVAALWLLSTMVAVVPPGNVGVPVTLGHAGEPLGEGFHLTVPLTTVKNVSVRTTAYTMSATKGADDGGATDDSVQVLGADGAAGTIDSTVLFRVEADRATDVYDDIGIDYVQTLIRPSARACLRSVFTDVSMVAAATTAWHDIEDGVTTCMLEKLDGRGILLEDFQLREVRLDPTLQAAVTAKTAAEQDAERQQFELEVAEAQAEITRVDAKATADSQQILACGGHVQDGESANGQPFEDVVPNSVDDCSQAQLTPQYLQWTYIQALQGLVDSPNNSTIILPFDEQLTPLLNLDTTATQSPELAPPTAADGTDSATTSDAGSATPEAEPQTATDDAPG